MDFFEAFKALQNSNEFKDWKSRSENKESYLAHGYVFSDSEADAMSPAEVQFGYYSPIRDRVTIFNTIHTINNIVVTHNEETELFKKESDKIMPILTEKVKFSYKDSLDLAKQEIKINDNNNNSVNIIKSIILLQNLKEHGQIWNITFITSTLHVFNIKIDTLNGAVKAKLFEPLTRFATEMK